MSGVDTASISLFLLLRASCLPHGALLTDACCDGHRPDRSRGLGTRASCLRCSLCTELIWDQGLWPHQASSAVGVMRDKGRSSTFRGRDFTTKPGIWLLWKIQKARPGGVPTLPTGQELRAATPFRRPQPGLLADPCGACCDRGPAAPSGATRALDSRRPHHAFPQVSSQQAGLHPGLTFRTASLGALERRWSPAEALAGRGPALGLLPEKSAGLSGPQFLHLKLEGAGLGELPTGPSSGMGAGTPCQRGWGYHLPPQGTEGPVVALSL